MDRELLLVVLGLMLAGATVQIAAFWPETTAVVASTARTAERRCWRRLWAPIAPTLVVICALAGWVAFEPAEAELLPRSIAIMTLPFAFIWARAVCRALKSACRRPRIRAAGAMGLLRPRVFVSETFRPLLDERALTTALAHEAAHVRHRDPLRLWLAQFATDLQWPSRRAVDRFRAWTRALECARDDEARRSGTEGADLAAALIAAVRLQEADGLVSTLVTDAEDFETRIRRLLAPQAPEQSDDSIRLAVAATAVAVLIAVTISGARFGETIVRTVLSALP